MEIEWIIDNWASILQIVSYLISAGWIVAKLTPNKRDDEWLGKIQKFFDVFNNNKITIKLKK